MLRKKKGKKVAGGGQNMICGEVSPLIPPLKDGLLKDTAQESERASLQESQPLSSHQLRGLLKLISDQIFGPNTQGETRYDAMICQFHYDLDMLLNIHGMLLKLRRLRKQTDEQNMKQQVQEWSFQKLVLRHRFVCFFFVQGNSSHHYSRHTLRLRKLLAGDYHDSMTTFVVMVGNTAALLDRSTETAHNGARLADESKMRNTAVLSNDKDEESMDPIADNSSNGHLFFGGTGFAVFPSQHNAMVLSMLNITQLPSVVVIDTTTGRVVSSDTLLAIERNDPHYVINSWQQGKSGLSCFQKAMAVMTCESTCAIQ